MFCKNCGAKLDNDAMFCNKCGTVIKKNNNSNKPAPDRTLSYEGVTETVSIAENPSLPVINPRKKRPIVLVSAIAAVVVAAVIAILFLGLGTSTSDPRAESNFNNAGKFAYDNKALYFVGLYNEDDSNTCLYSTSYTGTNKTLISNNPDISKIRIANGKILFQISTDDTYSIGIMETDGSNSSVIIELNADNNLRSFNVSSSRLYYLYGGELRSCSMDGSDNSMLLSDVVDFIIVGNIIYYTTSDAIYSYDIKKDYSTEICRARALYLVFDDGKIYFKNDNGIYSVAATGKEVAQSIVKDSSVGHFVVTGDDIYYIQIFEPNETLEIAKVIDDSPSYIYVAAMLSSSGQLKRVAKTGGVAENVNSNQPISASLFVYPNGMYSKISVLLDTFDLVEFE